MQQRQVGQMGPSIGVCPSCYTPKDPQQLVCSICNTKSCPNGHILSNSARICHVCNWVDKNWKQPPIIHQQPAKTVEKSGEVHVIERCPHCGSAIDPKMQTCGFCGSNISASEMEQESILQKTEPVVLPKVEMRTVRTVKPTPPPVPTQTSQAENKAEYTCPDCNSRVDDPTSGQCNKCGHTGAFLVSFSKQGTQRNVPQTTVQRPPVQYTRVSPPQVAPPPPPPPATQIFCHQCGAGNPSIARFCRVCGTPLEKGSAYHPSPVASMNINQPPQREAPAAPAPAYLNRVDTRQAAPIIPVNTTPHEPSRRMPEFENITAPASPVEKEPARRGNPYLIITIVILVAIVVMLVFLYISRI